MNVEDPGYGIAAKYFVRVQERGGKRYPWLPQAIRFPRNGKTCRISPQSEPNQLKSYVTLGGNSVPGKYRFFAGISNV